MDNSRNTTAGVAWNGPAPGGAGYDPTPAESEQRIEAFAHKPEKTTNDARTQRRSLFGRKLSEVFGQLLGEITYEIGEQSFEDALKGLRPGLRALDQTGDRIGEGRGDRLQKIVPFRFALFECLRV